ncbi:MAG: GntR family transcriptional regulator [Lachnospiraceae bacterium]|jgi:GntR family transcriptional regulator|nr:GntR family transcriptional regulator [Lachnospiraceae bacterium]
MLWNIDFRDKRPIYEQIVSGMENEIIRGIMIPDEPLPSVRSLAMELSINPNTIQKAYRQLESDGYTYSVPGRGSFVKNVEEVREMKKKEMLRRIMDLIRQARELGISEKEISDAVKGGRTND